MATFFPSMGSLPPDLRSSSHGTWLRTGFWAAKLAFLLLGFASTVLILVRIAVPLSRELLLSTLPRLCTAARSYLVPPYIFVVVNFIILVILKLPDTKNQNHQREAAGGATATGTPPKPPKDLRHSSPSEISPNALADNEGPESSPKIGDSPPRSWSDSSCLTTDFEGDWAVSPPASSTVIVQNTAESGVKTSDKPSAPVEDHDSMDATWRAITGGGPGRRQLKKNETWSTPPRVQLQPGTGQAVRREMRKSETFRESSSATRRAVVEGRVNGREVAVAVAEDHDDVNRQFDAFIKKVNDQMRLQREESAAQRYMEMVNSPGY